jgi:peroxiredoxin
MFKQMLTGFLNPAVPEIGTVIEDFTVTDTDGKELVLSGLVGLGPVVVAFFPKAFTPG